MGLDYRIFCDTCKDYSDRTEFSVCGYVEIKHPDEAPEILTNWAEFLAEHQGHKIHLQDDRGNFTNPKFLNGKYILGIEYTLSQQCNKGN